MPKKSLKIILWISAISVVLLAFLMMISRVQAQEYVVGNVFVFDRDLYQVDYSDLEQVLRTEMSQLLQKKQTLILGKQEYYLAVEQLGLEIDYQATAQRVREISYGEDLWAHVNLRLSNFRDQGLRVFPVMKINQAKLNASLEELGIIGESIDARLYLVDGEMRIDPEVEKYSVNLDTLESRLLDNFQRGLVKEVALPAVLESATYTKFEAESDRAQTSFLLNRDWIFRNDQLNFSTDQKPGFEQLHYYKGRLVLDQSEMKDFWNQLTQDYVQMKSDLIIEGIPDSETVGYAQTEGEIRDGYQLNLDRSVANLRAAIAKGQTEVELSFDFQPGKIISGDFDLGEMKLLAKGKSDFAGSDAGRAFNVRKGLLEKMNYILIPPGAEFSFNEFLGPVTSGAGWRNALAIFNGKDLVPVPGGGLCQVSTTIYRAALNAGLEVSEQRNHSLYVKYYKAFGNGLDATIYPGQQDLKFVNDTGNYILLVSSVDGTEATVDFYGQNDGRKVILEGPFYWNTIPEKFKKDLSLGRQQIAWFYQVTYADGSQKERFLRSNYLNAISR